MRTELERALGYEYKNRELLRLALSHTSYANEIYKDAFQSYERLEFLGDSILGFVTADYLYRTFPDKLEGELSRIRAELVCEKNLAIVAEKLSLGEYLLLGNGEEQTGGRERPSVVSDAFEALIAGIYLDGGLEAAQRFVLPFVEEDLTHEAAPFVDYKTRLQEIIQKNPEERVEYVLVSAEGPDHDKKFVVEVHLNSNVIGRGASRSKKGAEQAAAHEALTLMGED